MKKGENLDTPTVAKFKNEQHQKHYHMIIDVKYIKMMVKRSYRAENLYEFLKNLSQLMNTVLLELEPCNLNPDTKFDSDFVKRKLNLSRFGPQSMDEYSSNHGNRAREIIKTFDSLYKRIYANNIPALADFSVDLIDTEDYNAKFDEKNQKVKGFSRSIIREVCGLPSEEILKRLDFRDEELPGYNMFAPFSGIFFVVNFTLRENLRQSYSPTKKNMSLKRFIRKYLRMTMYQSS